MYFSLPLKPIEFFYSELVNAIIDIHEGAGSRFWCVLCENECDLLGFMVRKRLLQLPGKLLLSLSA
jgi:hypothetical protein